MIRMRVWLANTIKEGRGLVSGFRPYRPGDFFGAVPGVSPRALT